MDELKWQPPRAARVSEACEPNEFQIICQSCSGWRFSTKSSNEYGSTVPAKLLY